MSNYHHECQQSGHHTGNHVFTGNSIDIKMVECEAAEVRADVVVESVGNKGCDIVRLWGQVKDCHGRPVANALLKLVKVIRCSSGIQYQGIAHTISDCEGFYQFDLCYCEGNECYKVLVSKAYDGPEQVLHTGGGNCDACMDKCGKDKYQPCKSHPQAMAPDYPSHNQGCKPPHMPCEPKPCMPKPCMPCEPKPCNPCQCEKTGYQYQEYMNISAPSYR